ncbi:hypothetical protein ROZALSC1DRAFT_30586 [Rozella allomycis CSF55]|uniref:Uncharacterized protein n=1 Tax=Rozella allomycis (strain CSF55) TaxID=988480 RepID=A0A4P9YHB6_ROZAC|nr:hypothetical protein ROZALSC1DRAFT_30586 [Rozella allomycis CSF55]
MSVDLELLLRVTDIDIAGNIPCVLDLIEPNETLLNYDLKWCCRYVVELQNASKIGGGLQGNIYEAVSHLKLAESGMHELRNLNTEIPVDNGILAFCKKQRTDCNTNLTNNFTKTNYHLAKIYINELSNIHEHETQEYAADVDKFIDHEKYRVIPKGIKKINYTTPDDLKGKTGGFYCQPVSPIFKTIESFMI